MSTTQSSKVCVFLLHTALKQSLLKTGHRVHPGDLKEKADIPPYADTSSENACTLLSRKAHGAGLAHSLPSH